MSPQKPIRELDELCELPYPTPHLFCNFWRNLAENQGKNRLFMQNKLSDPYPNSQSSQSSQGNIAGTSLYFSSKGSQLLPMSGNSTPLFMNLVNLYELNEGIRVFFASGINSNV